MGRSIITSVPEPTLASRSGPGSEPAAAPVALDNYGDALLKLIPAEVIGVYIAMQSILSNAKEQPHIEMAFIVVFLFGVFATFFYLRFTMKVKSYVQLLLSVGAFCVWAYTMVPETNSWYNGTYAGLLLLAYTFIAPKISMEVKNKS